MECLYYNYCFVSDIKRQSTGVKATSISEWKLNRDKTMVMKKLY